MKIIEIKISLDDVIRFNNLICRVESEKCWPFVGGTTDDGYGCFYAQDMRFLAHRVAYYIAYSDPGKLLVCHECDNPICCNPRHLFLGTSGVNIRDSVAKGRHSSKTLMGEARPNSVLTEIQVKEIRFKRDLGYTLDMLGKEYKVDLSTIHQIVTRKTWRHV